MALPIHKLPGSAALDGFIVANAGSASTSKKVNFAGAGAPTVNEDSGDGYSIGSRWLDLTNSVEYICFDATVGAAEWVSLGVTSLITKQTISYTNTFNEGQPIRRTATNFELAQADSQSNAEVLGAVESSSGTSFVIVYSGRLSWPSHGFTVGAALYLDPTTPGALTETAPSANGQVVKLVAIALDADNIVVNPTRGVLLSPGATQATESFLGIARIASQAITDAGTDDTRIVTPLKLATTPRLPTQAENDALQGTSGVPSGTNRYVTNTDSRLSDSRTPTAHASSHHPGGSDALSWSTAHGFGLFSARPSAASTNTGFLYFASDTLQLYRSNGTTWDTMNPMFPYAKLSDVKATNVDGGTFTAGALQTRTLNTKSSEFGPSFCTLSSSQFTLQAGGYRVRGQAPASQVNAHILAVYNTSDSVVVEIGQTGFANSGAAGNNYVSIDFIFGISAQKSFELRHQCETTKAGTGFGESHNFGYNNIYSIVEIWKLY